MSRIRHDPVITAGMLLLPQPPLLAVRRHIAVRQLGSISRLPLDYSAGLVEDPQHQEVVLMTPGVEWRGEIPLRPRLDLSLLARVIQQFLRIFEQIPADFGGVFDGLAQRQHQQFPIRILWEAIINQVIVQGVGEEMEEFQETYVDTFPWELRTFQDFSERRTRAVLHQMSRDPDSPLGMWARRAGRRQQGSGGVRSSEIVGLRMRVITRIRNMRAIRRLRAGCGGQWNVVYMPIRKKSLPNDLDDQVLYYMEAVNPRCTVAGNNCIPACFVFAWKETYGKNLGAFPKRFDTIRKELSIPLGEKMTVGHIDMLSIYFCIRVSVYDETGLKISDHQVEQEEWPFFSFLVWEEHAYVLKKNVGKCTWCAGPLRPGHIREDGLCCLQPCGYCGIRHREQQTCLQHPEARALRNNDEFISESRKRRRLMSALEDSDLTTTFHAMDAEHLDRFDREYAYIQMEHPELNLKLRIILATLLYDTRRHLMILGPGGVGKTFLVAHLFQELHTHRYGEEEEIAGKLAFVAPTGQAASLLPNGQTLHSFFHILPSDLEWDTTFFRLRKNTKQVKRLRALDTLVIDEISMLTGELLDRMDQLLRKIRREECSPFGGVRVVLLGDFLQLPPVDSGQQQQGGSAAFRPRPLPSLHNQDWSAELDAEQLGFIDFAFDAKILRYFYTDPDAFRVFQLKESYRHQDAQWFELLELLRFGRIDRAGMQRLSARVRTDLTEEEAGEVVLITPFNARRKQWNDERLCALPEEAVRYSAEDSSAVAAAAPPTRTRVERQLSTKAPKELILKKGARVMLLSNHLFAEHGLANGSMGTLLEFRIDQVLVAFDHVRNTAPSRNVWVRAVAYTIDAGGVKYTRKQLPLTLCFAMTIHKAQGMTLSKAYIDLDFGHYSRPFAFHLAYVALSRVRQLEDLWLRAEPKPEHLQYTNERCMTFMTQETPEATRVAPPHHPLPAPTFENTTRPVQSQYHAVLKMKKISPWERHQKQKNRGVAGAYQFKVQQRSIFFDVETCQQSLTNVQLDIYSIVAKTFEFGKETNYLWKKERSSQNLVEEFGDWVFKLLETWRTKYQLARTYQERTEAVIPWRLCAFNGANFDFHFFLQYLFQKLNREIERYRIRHLFRAATIIQFSLYLKAVPAQPALVVHDIGRFLVGMSLERSCKSFIGKKLKGHFPHREMNVNPLQWRLVLPEADAVDLTRGSFFLRDLISFDALKSNTDLERFQFFKEHLGVVDPEQLIWDAEVHPLQPFRGLRSIRLSEVAERYVTQDVDALYELYLKMDEIVLSTLHVSIMDFFSANQLAMYGFLLNLPYRALYNPGNSYELITKLYRWSYDQDQFAKDAIYGGRVLPRLHYWKSDPERRGADDYLVMTDITSMYVAVMLECSFPIGPCQWMSKKELREFQEVCDAATLQHSASALETLRTGMFCIVEVDLELHPNELEPPIAMRTAKGRILWDNARRTGVYCNIDVYLALRNQGRVFSVKRGVQWSQSLPLFQKWMRKTLQWKTKGTETGNIGLRSFGKLCGNSTYGGFAMRNQSNTVRLVFSENDMEGFFREADWEGIFCMENGWVMYGKNKDFLGQESRSAKYLAVYVLAYSRLMLDDFISALCPNRRAGTFDSLLEQPLYGDTDSLIFHVSQVPRIRHLLGSEPGLWTDDLNEENPLSQEAETCARDFARIQEYVSPAPKIYACKYFLPAAPELVKEKLRCKGIRMDAEITFGQHLYARINFDILKRCVVDNPNYDLSSLLELPPHFLDRPESESSSIRRVGARLSWKDRIDRVGPFSLQQARLARSLFKTLWKGRKRLEIRKKDTEAIFRFITAPLHWSLDQLVQQQSIRQVFVSSADFQPWDSSSDSLASLSSLDSEEERLLRVETRDDDREQESTIDNPGVEYWSEYEESSSSDEGEER